MFFVFKKKRAYYVRDCIRDVQRARYRNVVVIAGVDVCFTSFRIDPPNFRRSDLSKPPPPTKSPALSLCCPLPSLPPSLPSDRLEKWFGAPFASSSALCTTSRDAGVAVAHTHAYPKSAKTARAALTPWYELSLLTNALDADAVVHQLGTRALA